jgi:hypothetical protein
MRNPFSPRLEHACTGFISVLLIVLVTLLAPPLAFSRTMPTVTLFLLLSPATMIAVYSVFFEQSKLYGTLGLVLIAIAVVMQPLAGYWAKVFLPEAAVFAAFCVVVSVLKRCRNL